MSSFNNVEVNLTGTSIIREGAFAELFAQAVQNIADGSLIDIVINVGSGNIVIESSAFQQLSNLPNNITLNSASFNFAPGSVPTLGANFASGLPVRALSLPAQTTLQPNALQNLPVLQHLDISQLTNPVPTNGLNLTRTTTAPLLISMPTTSVPFASGAVVFPNTGTNATTTLIFNGAVPSTTQLNEMFTVNTATVTAPIQLSLNYSNTSNVTNAQLSTLSSVLNNPVVVSFTQVQSVIQGLTQPTNIQAGGALTNISQFAGELFDSIPIAPKVQGASALNQTVIVSLSSDAIASNVSNIPVPPSIKKIDGSDPTDRNVVGLVSRMNITVMDLTPTPFYIVDNYVDPSDTDLPPVPLIAIFSRANAGTAVGSFHPALVCNGSLTVSNGSVVVSGNATGLNAYCRGYNAVGSAAQVNTAVNLLALPPTNGPILIFDRSQLSNALPIARITIVNNTFSVHFNPIVPISNSNTPDVVLGCMQDYRPPGNMVVDFTNSANAANAAWTTFSSTVANVIARNNALVALVNQIRGQALPAGVTVTPALPLAIVSISDQLTALSQSDFSLALKNWRDVQARFVLYDAYLSATSAYVVAAIAATGTNQGSAPAYVAAQTAFNGFKASLDNATGDLATVRTQLTVVNGVAPLYTTAVSNYIGRRLSIGRQSFKTCTTMSTTTNFEFLRNISNINDETFGFCNALSSPINIPVNVVSIGANAYNSCTGVPSIDIQNAFALRTIGNGAFEGCMNATGNIAFSSAIGQAKSVEIIGDRAFFGCTKLTGHIYFPPGLQSLGVSAFENCSSLNGTVVFPVNDNFTAIPNNAFAGCSEMTGISTNTGNGTSLMYLMTGYPLALVGLPIPNGLNLPANITQIGENAFLNCSKFAGALNLQQQQGSAIAAIASIGNSAFQGCSAFTSLVLPSTPAYTLITANCFRGCTNITSLTLSSNILHVSDSAFRGCNKIANVPQLTNIISIGNDAFNACSGIVGALVLGENLTLLGDRAFFDCPLLTSATFLGPRPQGLSQAVQIFGLTAGASTPFYVNVFTENGWDGTDIAASNAVVVINKGFRAFVTIGSKSLVQMSHIDFNTYVPSSISREITLNNYQSFNVFDNSSDTTNVFVNAPPSGHSWNDVLLPSTLIGKDLASALQNFNPSSNIQNLITTLVTPKIDAVQSSSLDSSVTANAMLNVFDGRNFEVKASAPGTPIELNSMTSVTDQSTSANWYGVFTDTAVNPNVDRLYFASTTGTTPVQVNGVNNEVLCYFVTSTSPALSAKYANKIITVDSTGAITVSSNVAAIGFGAVDAPTAVLFTSDVPTTARTGKGYTIVKSVATGVLDKMYVNTLFAPAGTYYIGLVRVGGSVQSDEDRKYNGVVVHVAEDGSARVLESQLNHHFIDISNANVHADEAAFNAANPNGGYGFITAQQSGANTPFKLLHKANAVATSTTAASYYYHVHFSTEASVNNRLILVLLNGGVSVASFGVSGSVRRLQNQITALTAQSIPIYSSNQDFQNFDYHLNGVMSLAQIQLTNHAQELRSKVTAFSERYIPLKAQIEPMAIFANVAGARPDVVAFATAFNALTTSGDALLLGTNGTNGVYNAHNAALAQYVNALFELRDVSLGQTGGVIGLKQIQSSTLNDPVNGILRFRRDSTFNANALESTVIANPESDPNGLVNTLDFVTTQMNQFLRELLYRQYTNSGTDFASTTVPAVKTSALFAKSPSSDVSAANNNLMYNDLSIQQRVLFDHVVNAVNLWFKSATPGQGGNSNWGSAPTSTTAGTGLFSVAQGEATKAALLAWGQANIFAYFVKQGQDIYSQFYANNQPNTIASLANIRASMTDYETTRNQPANNTVPEANVAARRTYIRVAAVGTSQSNVAIDTTSQAALTAADNGKLRFNNATIASATKLYISLNDGQATPASISLNGYFDEIRLTDNLAFRVSSVTTTAACHELDVTLVPNSVSNSNPVASYVRYQTISEFTLARLDAVNSYVYGLYYQSTSFNGTITATKTALTQATAAMIQQRNNLLTAMENLNRGIHDVVQKSVALNQSENLLMATFRNVTVPGTPADLDGANMLRRESELLDIALRSAAPPPSPSYETEWFKNRVAAFWVAQASATQPTIANHLAAYSTANTAYIAQRMSLQEAAIDSFVANTLASQDFTLPVTTLKLAEQVQIISTQIPVSLTATMTKENLAKLIAEKIALYVLGRTIKIDGLNGPALVAARNEYQNARITETTTNLNTQKILYGRSAYSRYLAVIDFAIATAYYPGLAGAPALAGAATNAFQTLMQQWNAASNNQKDAIFSQIQPLLTQLVYTTDATNTYTATSFPLTANGEVVSWFGSTQNGSLNTIINNAFTFANHALDYTNGIPLATYNLPSGRTVTFNGATITLNADNTIIVTVNGNAQTKTLITAPAQPPTSNPPALSSADYNSQLRTAVVAVAAPAPAPVTAASFTPFNLSASAALATAVSSSRFAVVSIGYSSLPISQPVANWNSLGFANVTPALQFTVAQDNGTALYRFTRGNNIWHYGRQQSAALINSWARASPNQNVVIFYQGVADSVPANLVSDNVNALCDNATYVMLIESNNNDVYLYNYDVFGVNSGALIAVGTLAPTPALYSVGGALQKRASNPATSPVGINLVGNLVIPAQCRTVGINAFSGSNQIRALAFSANPTNQGSLAIGSNAFEACTLLPEINLSASVRSIAPSAFLKCTGAASLVLPPATTSNFSVVNHWAFLGCNNIANDVQLNSNLVQISVQSFAGCARLRCARLNENLPSSVQRIGAGAFLRCVGLTGGLNFNNLNQNGTFVSSVSVIGSSAFMGCSGLNGQLVLPDNVNYGNVLPYTFASIDAPLYDLNSHQIANPNAVYAMRLNGGLDFALNKVKTIERNAFFRCSNLVSIGLSNAITAVAPQAFMHCSGILQNLLIPASVKSIGSEAFRGCSSLAGLNIVSTVVSQLATEAWLSLGNNCFQDCTSIVSSNSATGLVIPNSVNSIGDGAFQGCTSIVSVNVGSGLTRANSFGSLVFNGCTRLERVTLAFSFISRDVAGQSVVKLANTVAPLNDSFAGCTALGVPAETPTGTIQIQSGSTGWTPGRAAFFNRLTIVINNRNITFYLKEFDQLAKINVVDPSTEPLQLEAVPPTDAQATVHIKASDMRKVFLTSTDSFVNGETDVAQMFFVRPELLPRILNVANAHVVQGGIESYNAKIYEQLVKDDVMRYYAMSLFNSADWVSLFANDTEMIENMVASSGLMPLVPDGNVEENGRNLSNTGVLHNIMRELEKVGYVNGTNPSLVSSPNYPATGVKWKGLPDSVLPENGNLGRKLFGLINRNDPNRISSMVLNGSTPSELPFLPGDQFIFIFTLNENSVTLNPSLPPVIVKKRTYLIRMILTDDFNSGNSTFAEHFNALYNPSPLNQNILPVSGAYAADYMYSNYNLYMAIKPSVTDQTADSVYRRITQNTFEPIPTPRPLLPFTGWYYSYTQNTQTIRLNFTPPGINDSTNKMLYNDLRYMSAYVYFPNNWSSVTSLPNVNSFPQWVLTFSNGADRQTIRFRANFLNTGAETVNYLGQTVPFDFTNTHVQLLLPFDFSESNSAALIALLTGTDGEGVGMINTIAGTFIRRQRSDRNIVRGLRRAISTVGPFTYPPIARGYQCIPMSIPTIPTGVAGAASQYHLESAYLEINMSNENGFVPNIIVKSVEVVAKNYDAYYLAPLDPN